MAAGREPSGVVGGSVGRRRRHRSRAARPGTGRRRRPAPAAIGWAPGLRGRRHIRPYCGAGRGGANPDLRLGSPGVADRRRPSRADAGGRGGGGPNRYRTSRRRRTRTRRRPDRRRRQRTHALHDRLCRDRAGERGADDRHRQQPRHTATACRRPPCADRNRGGTDRRLHPHEGGNGAESRA